VVGGLGDLDGLKERRTGSYRFAGPVEVWDVDTTTRVAAVPAHRGHLTPVEFTPDGGRLLVSSTDMTARVWDAATGGPVGPPLPAVAPTDGGPPQRRLSPDGRFVLTLGTTGPQIMDGVTGERHGMLSAGIAAHWFGADGRRVVVAVPTQNGNGSPADTLQITIDPFPLSPDALGALTRLMTGKQIDGRTDGVEPLPPDAFTTAPAAHLAAWREWVKTRAE
jgi:hypothetical protein